MLRTIIILVLTSVFLMKAGNCWIPAVLSEKQPPFFKGSEPVLVHNVDVASGINLVELASYHSKTDALATLCVRKRNSTRALLFDENMALGGWANLAQSDYKWVSNPQTDFHSFAYSGVYLAHPAFAEKLPFDGHFSIIDAWLKMAETERIIGFEDQSDYWFDLGTKEKIVKAEAYFGKNTL